MEIKHMMSRSFIRIGCGMALCAVCAHAIHVTDLPNHSCKPEECVLTRPEPLFSDLGEQKRPTTPQRSGLQWRVG